MLAGTVLFVCDHVLHHYITDITVRYQQIQQVMLLLLMCNDATHSCCPSVVAIHLGSIPPGQSGEFSMLLLIRNVHYKCQITRQLTKVMRSQRGRNSQKIYWGLVSRKRGANDWRRRIVGSGVQEAMTTKRTIKL